MLLSIQQRYILETLKKLGCIRRRQLHVLVQNEFPRMNVSDRSMDAMLRQMRCGMGQARDSPGRVVWISDSGEVPTGLKLPKNHFFAARQPDGSHRFYGS